MPYIGGWRTATSNTCPLCYPEDSGSHLLGGSHRNIVKSYFARHNKAGRLILSAITEGTSGNNVFIADLGTQENMQAVGALDTRLPPQLAQQTTISGLLQDGEERDRINGSLDITASHDPLKTRPDIMMVGLTTDKICDQKKKKWSNGVKHSQFKDRPCSRT